MIGTKRRSLRLTAREPPRKIPRISTPGSVHAVVQEWETHGDDDSELLVVEFDVVTAHILFLAIMIDQVAYGVLCLKGNNRHWSGIEYDGRMMQISFELVVDDSSFAQRRAKLDNAVHHIILEVPNMIGEIQVKSHFYYH